MSNLLKNLPVPADMKLPDLTGLFSEFEGLKTRLKQEDDRDGSLKDAFIKAARHIAQEAAFVRFTPQSDILLLEQMYRDEKVHPVADYEEYIQTRIGMPGDHKAAFALAAMDKDGPRGLAAIYTYYDSVSCDQFGLVDPEDLRGDIHTIKTEMPRPFTPAYDPDVVYFYTVSSKLPKAAYTLIAKVGALHAGFLKSTISPVREFTQTLDMPSFEALPAQERKRQVAAYISTREGYDAMNSVAFFHMDNGNGAYAASIKLNPGQPDDQVMMNYVYPSDSMIVDQNQRAFRAGYVPVGAGVQVLLPPARKDRVYVTDDILRVKAKPREDLFIDI